jgi:hypothetical protein
VGIQAATTAQSGAVQLTDSTASTSVTTAATPNSVKSAYDLADAAVPKSTIDAKGDLIVGSADNAVVKLTAGTNEERLVTDSATTSGLKYVADTTNYAIAAKGDLLVGTAADTVAALTAGSNGDTLVADSAATVGLRYSATPSASNPVINSAFQVWQRGTSVSVAASTANAYTADRWGLVTGANQASTVSRQTTGDTTNLPAIQYCGRFQRNSGQTGTGTQYLSNAFESINSIPFAGKTVTLSFYARKGADYSPTSSALTAKLYSGTGTDQQSNTGYTGAVAHINTTATLTATWQRFTASATVSSSATEISIEFSWTPTGTASTNDYFEVTGVQIDVGSVALPFRTQNSTIQGELAACQRYFYAAANGTLQALCNGSNYSATAMYGNFSFPVEMRVAPTLSATTGTGYYEFARNGAVDSFDSLSAYATSKTNVILNNTTEISGTAGHGGFVTTTSIFSGRVSFSAEL